MGFGLVEVVGECVLTKLTTLTILSTYAGRRGNTTIQRPTTNRAMAFCLSSSRSSTSIGMGAAVKRGGGIL